MDPRAKEMALFMANHLYDKRALDIVALDVSHLTVITDCMIICTGRSSIQVKALYDELDRVLSERGMAPRRREGVSEGRWIVLDCENVIVHIFHEQERSYYNLERLWMDGSNRLELPFNDQPTQG